METHRDREEVFELLNWAQALPQSPRRAMGRDRSLSRHFRYGTFPLISAVFAVLCVICADLHVKLLKYCCATFFCVLVIEVCIDDYFTLSVSILYKNMKMCSVPKFDSSIWNMMSKLLDYSKTQSLTFRTAANEFFFILFSVFSLTDVSQAIFLCLQIHTWPSCQTGWSEVGLIIMVLAMSFPADCSCHSSLCALCPWSTPPPDLIIDSSRPPSNWGHPKAYIQLQWRELWSSSSLVLARLQNLTSEIFFDWDQNRAVVWRW